MVNLERYRAFLAVVDNNSFTAAAAELGLSQPAVTMQIQKLEEELNGILFQKANKKVVALTPEGEELYEKVAAAMRMFDDAEKSFQQHTALEKGEIRIGISTILTKIFLMDKIIDFNIKYPGVKVTIKNGLSSDMIGLMKKGRLDVVVTTGSLDENVASSLVLSPESMISKIGRMTYDLVYNPDYFEVNELDVSDFLQMPFVMQSAGSCSRERIDKFFVKFGIKPNIAVEATSHELVKEFIKKGVGVGIIYHNCYTKEDGLERLVIGHEPFPDDVYMFAPKIQSSVVKAFITSLEESKSSSNSK